MSGISLRMLLLAPTSLVLYALYTFIEKYAPGIANSSPVIQYMMHILASQLVIAFTDPMINSTTPTIIKRNAKITAFVGTSFAFMN